MALRKKLRSSTKTTKKKTKSKSAKAKSAKSDFTYGKDDYLIIKLESKKVLGLAFSKGKLLLEESATSDEPKVVEFTPDQIVCNLGPQPQVTGKAFGVNIEIYQRDLKAGWPKPIHVYRNALTDREANIFVKAMKKAHKILEDKASDNWMGCLTHINLKSNTSKMEGCYVMKTTNAGPQDVLNFMPVDLTDSKYLVELILHESSHGIWYRQVPRDIKARWSALFNKRAQVQRIEQDDLDTLADVIIEFVKQGSRFPQILKELRSENPDEHDAFKEVISYVKKIHHIDKEELEALALTKPEKFKELWPTVTDNSTFKADITEYATKNVKEFFAESLSYFLSGHSLPKDVEKACKFTLKNLTVHY
ncbi:Phage protein [Phage NCTB]|nr:Phage protein [Phage NCTB]